MLFNSWEFLILLALTIPLYYLPLGGIRRKVWQVLLLLVSSALFYAWEEPRLLLLLFGSCIVNAIAVERILFWKKRMILNDECSILNENSKTGRADTHSIQNSKSKIQNPETRARTWLFWTVALNLAFLAFFKYAGFLANLLPEIPLTESLKHWATGIPLPVGISFYTFQGISLVVDVWRNDISTHTAERLSARGTRRAASITDTSFYIAFFPQLVAGPIVKAHEFIDQIGAKHFRDIDWITVRRGLVTGYFLKIFVADNLAEQTSTLPLEGLNLAGWGPVNLMSLLYGYSLQIFADFAGYSLIALGLGALFGYKLPPNFNFPYLSTSITEFWRRWHLSLSSWLRDYLYFPLGGNRKGTGRTYFNLFLVMFLGGLWHGAAWKFAIWGSLHGLALAAERLCKSEFSILNFKFWMNKPLGCTGTASSSESNIQNPTFKIAVTAVKWFVTFHLVTALWLTFMMPDMASVLAFFKGLGNIFERGFRFSGAPVFTFLFYGSAVVIYHAWGWLREHREHLAHRLARSPLEPLLHGVMVFLVVTNPGAPRGFIYFQF
jgi:alginate O-acetyltransferase complex protein AlgI